MREARTIKRRTLLAGAAALWPATVLGQQQPRRQAANEPMPPVVFVHGNGDSGALWINNIWRFEANGYKHNQLFAIDFSYPSALSDDSKIQPFRSSTAEALKLHESAKVPLTVTLTAMSVRSRPR